MLIVLWAMVLIGLLITHLTATGRTEARIAVNLATNAEAQAAADGAVAAAVFHVLDANQSQRWAADGSVHRVTVGRSTVRVRVEDEDGLVNPNRASDALLAALLREIELGGLQADGLAAAIADWREPGGQRGAGEPAYRAAGLDHGPPSGPFESVEELGRVLGMTPDILARLRPHLSLWTQNEMPSADTADPVVRRALDRVPQQLGGSAGVGQQQMRYTLSIEATAGGPGGARFTRHAVVRTNPMLEHGYTVVAWDTGDGE